MCEAIANEDQLPIWSLTAERIERLKDQIAKKTQEHEDLLALSEKDLWCADLDGFMEEWHKQLALDAEIQTGINRMGRRRSKKIGAGKSKTGGPRGDDDDYDPSVKKGRGRAAGGKAAAKPAKPAKTHQRFAEMWAGSKSKAKDSETEEVGMSDGFSDDDFMALGRSKAPPSKLKKEESIEPTMSDAPAAAPARNKRAAATKSKTWIVDDDTDASDDDDMLGDVGAMVKGITNGAKAEDKTNGRLSLFAMSRGPESQVSALPKTIRTKPSRTFDFDSHDDTNYEMLAKSSPRKSVRGDELDGLSDDDAFNLTKVTAKPSSQPPPKASATSTSSAAAAIGGKKARGRPASTKNKTEDKVAKPTGLSPAAKAYAAKKVKKVALSDDDDLDLEDEPVAEKKSAARGRPARTAAKPKPKATYLIESDEDDDVEADDVDDSDPFAMDDSE